MKKIKANKRVHIRNGMRHIERAVYIDEYGVEYFLFDGKKCRIYKDENGKLYSLFFNSVEYI